MRIVFGFPLSRLADLKIGIKLLTRRNILFNSLVHQKCKSQYLLLLSLYVYDLAFDILCITGFASTQDNRVCVFKSFK